MQTRITARQADVNDGLRAHIEQSVSKLGRYYDGIHDAHVILNGDPTADGSRGAEITLTVSRNRLNAYETATTHQDAVTACVRSLRRQVLRHKDKQRSTRQDRHR